MKIKTVTSNDQHVRLRIFEGDLELSDAAKDLVRLLEGQLAAERRHHQRTLDLLKKVLHETETTQVP